jgi:adenosylcobinamide-phosphate synthase
VNPHAVGLAGGTLLDALLGDPARWHPVAGFGRVAGALERRCYADGRARGAAYAAGLVAAAVLTGAAADRATRSRPVLNAATTAAATWMVLGGRSLGREALAVHDHLRAGDLDAARRRVTHLVGRDPSGLDADEVARASVESVAENTSDAVVAPLLWGALAGPAGLLGYRAVNTLDAMVGHRSPRYRNFGWAAARLDDAANLVPSRVAAVLAALLAPAGPAAALRAWRRDAHRHPSPNAGPVEAAFAGALGVRLGGVNHYGGRVDDRGPLGDGPPPAPRDLPRAVRLSRRVGAGSAALACAVAVSLERSAPTAQRPRRR